LFFGNSLFTGSQITVSKQPFPPEGKYLHGASAGAIKPEGWLLDQLNRMRDGLTGHLDEIYPEVVGESNGWLGGDGDGWERGPYWIDGLLPQNGYVKSIAAIL